MWETIAYIAATAVAAMLISAVSGLVWGPGATRTLSRRLSNAENRIEDVDVRITSEVKKRAAGESHKSRREARTEADVTEEALRRQTDLEDVPGVSAAGRVRTSGVFPISKARR